MTDLPELGMLEEVGLRDAWAHEAHSFTPWLAAHLDQLGKEIGIPLELEGTEVAVERFHADILARSPLDDSLVLIENQLETTDHTHLGQIMTYLAGLDAQIVIWVAAGFTEPHLSAIRWLNDHTVDPFAFFAVRVKVVRIGSSPLAPIFEVLARPNEWERRVQAIAQESGPMRDAVNRRREFWKRYFERHPDDGDPAEAAATSSIWHTLEDLGLVISLYVSKSDVGVFVRGRRGQAASDIHAFLIDREEELQERLGTAIGTPDRTYLLWRWREGDVGDSEQQDALADWLYEAKNEYVHVLEDLFGGDV